VIKLTKKYKGSSFLEKEIDILNEMSSDEIIYDESQDGPQEEPIVKEYRYDIKKWKEYKKSNGNK